MLGTARKRPSDQLDYDIDFERWLSDGDAIQDASAVASPSDVIVDRVDVYGQIVKVWVSGGISGTSYEISVTASTALGRVKEVAFNLRVAEC